MNNTNRQHIGRLKCTTVLADVKAVSYILTPMPMDDNKVSELAERNKTSIVVIEGMDWNHDLTPWPAASVMKGDEDFRGLAPEFLPQVLDVVKTIEKTHGMADAERTLIGISLSGLFAIWASAQTDVFANIGTLSGSYWYDGFTEWLKKQSKPTCKNIYIAVGEQEHASRNPWFATIEDKTAEVATILQQNNNVVFQRVPGTHYASVWPRLEGLFEGIKELKNK